MIKAAWCLGILVWLTGCQHTSPAPAATAVVVPSWVLDPQVEGYWTELGFAPADALSQQQSRIAEMAAMRAFSQNQRVRVSNTTTKVVVDGVQVEDNSKTRLSAANPMDFSRLTRLQTWVHPQTKDLYVLFGIPKAAE